MFRKKAVPLAVALGFAASLTFASAFAQEDIEQPRPGTRMQEPESRMQQPGQERPQLQQPQQRVVPQKGARGVDVGQIDKDGDKLVSTEEFKDWQESVFGEMDADRDDELTVLEFIVLNPTDMEKKQLQAQFQELDTQDKGKLSKDQFIDKTGEKFKAADKDGDGKLSEQELLIVIEGRG